MIYVIFLISIIIYLVYLYFKTTKEGFTSNPNKTKYFLIGNFDENLDTYLQSYVNKDGHVSLDYSRQLCTYDLGDMSNDNKLININNLLDLNVDKSFTYDICSNQIGNIFNPEDDESANNYLTKIQSNSVIIFSFGKNDIQNVRNELLLEGTNSTESNENESDTDVPNNININASKKERYKNALKNTKLMDFRRNNSNLTENKYLFLNLKTSSEDYNYNNYTLWNEALQEYVNTNNNYIKNNSNLDNSNNYYQVINTSKINVNQNGHPIAEGIPYDLHLFICKNERCDIGNQDCVNKFPSLFTPV